MRHSCVSVNALDLDTQRENLIFTGIKLQCADVANKSDVPTLTKVMEQITDICVDKLDCVVTSADSSSVHVIK